MNFPNQAPVYLAAKRTENPASDEFNLLELLRTKTVWAQAKPGHAYKIVSQGAIIDDLLTEKIGDDLLITTPDGREVVLRGFNSLCAIGECTVLANSDDPAAGDEKVQASAEAEEQEKVVFAAANEQEPTNEGQVETSLALDEVAAVESAANESSVKPQKSEEEIQGVWLWGGLGLITAGGLASSIVGNGGVSQGGVTYTTTAALGPILDGNTELHVHLYRSDGTLLGASNDYDSNTGTFLYTEASGYFGVVIAHLSDDADGPDHLDEATRSRLDAPNYLLAVAFVAEGEMSVQLSITPLSHIAATKMGVGIVEGTVSGSAALTQEQVNAANSQIAEVFGIVGGDVARDKPLLTIDAQGNPSESNAYGRALALISALEHATGDSTDQTLQYLISQIDEGLLSTTAKAELVSAASFAGISQALAAEQLNYFPSSAELLASIGRDAHDDDLTGRQDSGLTAENLNAIDGVSGAITARLEDYELFIELNPARFSEPATAAEVQAMIDEVNNTPQTLLGLIGADEDDGAATTTNATASQLNDIVGVSGALAANESAYQAYIDANGGNFSTPATAAEVQAMVTSVNDAVTLLAAIGADEDDGAATTTNATASQLNDIVGVSGALAANESAYQAYIDANGGNFSTPATAAEVQAMVTSVNVTQTLLANIGTDEDDGAATTTNATAAQLNDIVGVSGALAANESAYQAYIDANGGNFSTPATAAEVQAMVTSVNDAVTLLAAIGTDEDDGAATTTNATAAQLNDIVGVSGALAANESAYQAYIDANGGNFSTPATAAEVQAMVTSVNAAQTLLANIGTDEDDGAATTTNATAAQLNDIVGVSGALAANESAYQAYIDANGGNFSTPATAAEVQAMVTSVNNTPQTLLGLIGADEDDGAATTTNATASQLNDIVGVSGALAANESAYQAYIDANGGNFSTPATAAEVQAMVTSVNDAVTLLAAIGTDEDDGAATTTNATAAQLNDIVGVSGALSANEAAYQAYIDANGGNFSTPATAAEVQAMVTSVNDAVTLLAAIGTDEDDGAATTTNATAAQLNDIVGVSGALAANESAYQAYIDANGGNFSTPATAAEVQAMVTSVNAAQTLLANIGTDEDDGAATTTNATAAQLNDIVGVSGALAANESAYQAYIDANGGNFSTPATAAEVQAMVTSVNNTPQTLLGLIGADEDDGAATTTNATASQLNDIVGVSGALAANESAYQAYIDANGGNFSTPATAAEVQAMVTSVNDAVTLLAAIGTDEDDGAATTTNATAAQLNDIVGVSGALSANEAAYQAYIDANGGNFSTPATAAEVQAMVTSVNDAVTLLAAIGTDEDDGAATTTNATAAQLNDIVGVSGALAANESAYQAYIDANGGNFSTPATAAEVQAMVTSVNVTQTLLANIGTDEDDGAATTTNATAAQLNDIVGVSGALSANEAAYQAYIDANGGNFSTPATAAEVQAMVTSVNDAVTLLAAIGTDEDDGAATTTNATAAQLNDIVGVSGALAANESAYQAYIDANGGNFSTPATAAEVQAMVTSVNVTQTLLANIGTDEDDGAATTTNATAAQLNDIVGVSGALAANESAYQAYIDANGGNFSTPATAAEVQAMVTSVNDAVTLLAAIGADEDDGAATTTNATASQLNDIVGVSGALAANESAYQAYIDANGGNFSTPATAAEVQAMVTSVNVTQTLLANIGTDEDDGAATTTNATAAQLNDIVGVSGALAANESAYQAYIDANGGNFSTPATAAEVQAMVTSVNDAVTLLAAIGTDEDDGAATTTNATAAQLNDIVGVSGALSANEAAYQAYIDANGGNFSTPATAAEVQAMVTSVNDAVTLLAAIGTDEDDGAATTTNATAAQLNDIVGVSGALAANESAYQAYIDANGGNFSTPATAAEVQAMVTSVNVTQTLLANIGTDEDDGAATTTNATAAQLNDIVGVSGALAANESAYQAYIDANGGNFSTPATAAEVQAMVTSVNDAVTLLAAIGTDEDDGAATTTNATAAQLNDIVGVSGALAANEAAYQAYIDANGGNFSTPATAAEVQAMVTSVNVTQTLLANIGTDEDDGAATTTNATAAQLNDIVGVSGALAANESAYQAYIDANGGNFSTPATAAEVQAMVTSVNDAVTLLAAIGADEDDGAATTTNATASQLNDIVGVSGALAANEAAYQAYIDANGGNFSTPATAAEVQAMVTSVNDAVTLLAAIGTDEDDGAATTTNATVAQLNNIVGVSGALAANESAYQAYIDANGGNFSTPATAAEVQAMVTSVNVTQTLLANIGTDEDDGAATTTNATAAQLNDIVGVSGALAANESAYQAYIDANGGNFSTPATAAEVQAMVTSVNDAVTLLAAIGADEDDGAATTTNATASQLNDIVGVSGALAANEAAYQAYIDANGGNFSTPATAAEVQAMVTSVNDAVTLLAAIGTDEDDGAATTTNATVAQLNNIVGVSGALAANESAYQAYIDANGGNFSTPATAAEVQAMVTSVNVTQTLLANIGTDEDDGAATTTNATAAQLNDIVGVSGALAANESAYQAYIDANGGNFSTPATAAEVQAMVTSVNDAVTLLAAIGTDEDDGAATTTNATASQLNDIVGVSGALAANESAYQAYIDANGGNFSTPATAAEVQAMVTSVNDAVTLLAAIGTDEDDGAATTTNATAAQLNDIVGVSGALAANESAYQAYIDANGGNFSTPATAAEVQAMVTSVNNAVTLLAAIGADEDDGAATTTNATASQLNDIVGVSGALAANESAYQAYIDANGGNFSTPATAAEVQAMVNAVNTAITTISTAAQNNSATATTPTLADYAIADVSNVNASNLAAVNDALNSAAVTGALTDTSAEIQSVVDGYRAILASADGTDGNGTNPTQGQYAAIGVTGVDDTEEVKLLGDVIDGLSSTAVDQVSEVQALADAVQSVMDGAAGTASKPTLAELQALGINNVTADNIDKVQALFRTAAVDRAAVNSVDKIQALVNTIEDPPVNTVPGSQTVNEDTLLSISGISVADPEGNLATTQLSVTNGTLTVSVASSVLITEGALGGSTLTLTGNQNEINAALATLTYTGNANFNGSDTLTVLSTDSSSIPLSDRDTVAITVSPVADNPINTVPAAQTVNEDTLLSISGISVADPEGNVASTQLSVTSGTLTVSMAGGGTISAGANGSSTLTLSGNQTEINAALTTLTYTGNANFNGSDTLTVLSTDSSSIPLTDSDTVSITVSSVDDEPTLTATGDNSVFTEGGSAVSIFSNSDVDPVEPGQTFNRIVLTITNVGTGSNEYLTIIGTTFELVTAELRGLGSYGVEFDSLDRTVNNSDGTSTVILTHAAVHPGELEFVLNTMAYHTDGNDPTANGANRVITVTSLQDTGSNTAPSDNIAALNVQSTITVTPVNDEPTLTATSDNSVFTEGGSAVSVFSNSVVDPVESGQTFNRIVLTITNVGTGSNEYLTIFGDPLELVAASGLANKNFFGVALDSLDYVVTNSSGTTTITLTHSSVTTTELKDMLDGMTYHSSSDDPGANGANRVITVTSLRDTGSNTAPSDNIAALNVQSTITVTPVNDAPIVNNFNGDSFTYNENTGAQLIDQSTAATVTDADSANFDGGNLTVTIASGEDAAEDLLSVNTANVTLADSIAGSNVTVGGQVIGTLANAISEGNDFVVNFNVNATTARIQTLVQSVTYQNTDTTNPTGGDRTVRVTVTDGDGGTATSTSADVTITVNPAPKIDLDGSESGVGYTSSGISQANVESAAGVSIIDADGTVVDDSVSGGFSSLTIKANDTDINDQLIIDGTVDRTIALDTSSDLNNQAVTVGAVAYRLDYVAATDTLTITRADAGTITTTQARAFLDATNYRNDGTFDNKSRTFNITGTDTLGLVSALAITTIETLAPTTTQISHTVVATEDVAFDFAASNFVSDGSNLERIRIDSLSLNGGALFIDTDNNGVRDGVEEELLVGDEVSVTDITASRFSYSSAAHSDVDGDSFTFSAQNTGLGFSSSATSTINVNPAVDGVNLATTLAVSPSTTGGPTFGDFVFTAGTDTDDGDIGSFAATTSQFIVGGTDDDSLIGGQGNDFLFGDGSGEYFIIPVPQVSDLIDGDGTESISSIAVRNIPYGMLLSDGVVGGNTSAIGDTRVDITGWSTSNIQLLIFESSLANSDASVTDDISIVLDVVTVETATADTAAAPGTNTRLNSQTISIDLTPSTVTPGHDSIEGNGGNDTLVGNLGYDTLDGGAGNDTFYDTPLNFLNGSDGDDVFIISRQRNINNEYSDITLDFRSNTSTLDSDRSLSNSYYIEGDSGIDRVQIAEHGTILYFATGKNLDAEILDYNGFTDVTVEITTPANFSLASATAISFSDGIINGVGGTEGRIIFRLAYSDVVPGGASVLSSLFDQTIILEGNTSRGASTTGRQIIRAQNGVTDDIWYAAPGVYLLGGEVASGNPTNGNDQFIWGRGAADTGDTQMVATELVGFNRVNASADGLDAEELDTLDLRDLLVGEYFSGDATNVTDLGNLADYIWVGTGTGTTRDFIKIDVDGGGNPETDFDLAINLLRPTDVNVIRGTGDANSRIQTLIENGILLVDNQGAETAAPTSGHDILTGSVTADSIAGEAGNDTLSGLAGNDYLHGWTGNDTIYGGTNASAIGVGTVTGIASGSDANTGSGDDEIYGGAGTDVLYGQDGDDIIKGDQQVHYNILETNDAEGAVGSNSVDGVADSDDIIRGGSGSDTIYGNGGDDLLVWGIGDYGTAGAAGRDVDTVMDFRRFDATEDNRDGLDVLNLSDLLIGENQTTVTVDGVALDIGNLTKYLYIEKNDAEVKIYVDHDGSGELTSSNFDANTDLLIVLKTSPDSVVGTSSTQASMINFLIENGLVVTDVV